MKVFYRSLLLLICLAPHPSDGELWTFYYSFPRGGEYGERLPIAVDHNGEIWLGIAKDVFRLKNKEWTIYSPEVTGITGSINGIFVDNSNRKWFYSFEFSPVFFDDNTWKTFMPYELRGVFQIVQDYDDVLWFGGRAGVVRLNPDMSIKKYTILNSKLNHPWVHNVAVDANNVKWFNLWDRYPQDEDWSTDIATFDGSEWNILDDPNIPITGKIVTSISSNIKGTIAFGTDYSRIHVYDGNSWNTLNIEHIFFTIDVQNALWIVQWGRSQTKRDYFSAIIKYDFEKGYNIFNNYNKNEDPYSDDWSIGRICYDIYVDRNNKKWISTSERIWLVEDDVTPSLIFIEIPQPSSIVHNYPNPFNSTTTIEFTIPSSGYTTIEVYSINGQRIRELSSNYFLAGTYHITWDGRDENRSNVSSGIYLVRLDSGGRVTTNRMLLIK